MTSYNFFAALLLATFVVSERQAFSIPIAKGVRGGKKELRLWQKLLRPM